jgi:hypothetical protein
MDKPGLRYRINARDEIVFVDEAWDRFALENDGAEVVRERVLGRPLWDFITDGLTRQVYQKIVAHVRNGRTVAFTFRCDGPSCKRLLAMTISAGEQGSVEFATRQLDVQPRERASLLDRRLLRSEEFLRACAWCNRISVGPERWAEAEDAVKELRLFEFERMPALTHGICEPCFDRMSAMVDDEPAAQGCAK